MVQAACQAPGTQGNTSLLLLQPQGAAKGSQKRQYLDCLEGQAGLSIKRKTGQKQCSQRTGTEAGRRPAVSEESAWRTGLAGVNVRCGGGYVTVWEGN